MMGLRNLPSTASRLVALSDAISSLRGNSVKVLKLQHYFLHELGVLLVFQQVLEFQHVVRLVLGDNSPASLARTSG